MKYEEFHCPFCNQNHLLPKRVNRVTCGSKECKKDKKIIYARKAKKIKKNNAKKIDNLQDLKIINIEAVSVLDTGREQYNRYGVATKLIATKGFDAVSFFGSTYKFIGDVKEGDFFRVTNVTDGRFLVVLDDEVRVAASTDSISNTTKC